jgi:hypothetical protein
MKATATGPNFWLIEANGQTFGLTRTITARSAFIACDCGAYGEGTPCIHAAAVEAAIERANGNNDVAAAIEAAHGLAPKPAKARCPHYGLIKEFFAVARELGFDTGNESKDRWRGAIGMLLGRPLASRSELTGDEWAFATNALRMGRLFI